MIELRPILETLRDVGGVQGSFVIADNGTLVDMDLPAMFDPQLFAEVGPRIVRIKETFASAGDELDTMAIRFSDFKLHIRAMPRAFLCILSEVHVNMPALRMGIQLAQRRIHGLIGTSDSAGPPSSGPSSLAPPSWNSGAFGTPSSPPPSKPRPGLTYRGRPVK